MELMSGGSKVSLAARRSRQQTGLVLEHAEGSGEWWLNGSLYRSDGCAVENANGSKEHWLEGVYFENPADYFQAVENKTSESP
jgi:hypothetical protein